MKIGWIDSHAHLMDESLLIEIDEVIKRANENDVVRIMLIALSNDEMDLALRLKSKYPMLDIACGFHPSDVHKLNDKNWKKLEETLKTGKISAIGEIGLDFYWDKTYVDIQRKAFRRQLALADDYNLPVIIHMREATQDTFDILEKANVKKKGVMHCYTGSVEMAKRFVSIGYFISLAGPLTFKNANENIEVAKEMPLNKLLVETDSPFLTPEPYRGKANESAYVRYVGEKLSKIKKLDNFTVQSQLFDNYQKIFK